MKNGNQPTLKIIFFLAIAYCSLLQSNLYASENEDKTKDKLGYSWTIKSGLIYDSNVYRAPDAPYVDYADSCDIADPETICTNPVAPPLDPPPIPSTIITPTTQDSSYLRLNAKPRYRKKLANNHTLDAKFKFDGYFHTDAAATEADNYKYSLQIGDEIVLRRQKTREDSLYVEFLTGHVNKLYLDRDSGDEKTSSTGENISERYIYDYTGVDIRLKLRTTKLKYDFKFKNKKRVYNKLPQATPYDNTYQLLGAKVKARLSKISKLSLAYDYYTYKYVERNSRTALGRLVGPAREYIYHRIKTSLRQRYSKKWLAYFDYEHTIRFDQYVGYDDYDKDKIKIRVVHELNPRWKFKYSLTLWQRNYDNAFAFDINTRRDDNGTLIDIKKEYDGQEIRMLVNFKATKKRVYILDLRYQNDNSTDLRYDYDRLRFGVGVEWES